MRKSESNPLHISQSKVKFYCTKFWGLSTLGTIRISGHDRYGPKSPKKLGFFLCLLSKFVFCGMAESINSGGMYCVITPPQTIGYLQNGEMPMPKRIAPLSDIQVKNAKPQVNRQVLHSDSGLISKLYFSDFHSIKYRFCQSSREAKRKRR